MGSIDSYIFRTTFVAFLVVLFSLTGVIWITQALRGIDLMTSQGQTILVFIGVTGLAIPSLILVITPIALVIAIAHVLNKLANDSEIIVMNASGMKPWRMFRPFLLVTLVVCAMVAFVSSFLAPDGLRRLKRWEVEITADVLTNILQTGRFMEMEPGLTLRVRERRPGGQLAGIFVDDRRDPKERVSIIADHGTVLKNETGSFLILDDGNLQRFEVGRREPALVVFERYAFDMSKFARTSTNVSYNVRERYLWELAAPEPNDDILLRTPGLIRAEFHDRVLAPIYPLAFAALTFAFLGAPRTTRQSRSFSMAMAIVAVGGLRIVGFALSVMAVRSPYAAPAQYALMIATFLVSAWIIRDVVILEPPAALTEAINRLTERMTRRAAPA
jgi:lipopolysaccharide export system permease protein